MGRSVRRGRECICSCRRKIEPIVMSAPLLMLEYELTADRLRDEFRHSVRTWRRRWGHRIAVVGMILLSVHFLRNGDYLFAAVIGILCFEHHFLLSIRLLMAFSFRLGFQSSQVRFVLDDRGIVQEPPPKFCRDRYWWKSLRRVSEDEHAFKLDFGFTRQLQVPVHAFANDAERESFRSIVMSHLPTRQPVAAGR